jgi:hypothetical protein
MALEEVQESLQADHADIEIIGVTGSTANVRLVFGPQTCQECIVGKEILQSIMLVSLQRTMPQITAVRLEDPRDARGVDAGT